MDMRSPNSNPATIPANAPSPIQPGSEIARRPRFCFAAALGAVCASGPSVSSADLIEWAELTFSDIRRCLKLPRTLEQTILQRALIQLQRVDLLAWGSAKTPITAPPNAAERPVSALLLKADIASRAGTFACAKGPRREGALVSTIQASFSHFCMKLFLAAPESFLPSELTAFGSHASRLHVFRMLLSAAPASGLPFLSIALLAHVSCAITGPIAKAAIIAAKKIRFMDFLPLSEPAVYTKIGIKPADHFRRSRWTAGLQPFLCPRWVNRVTPIQLRFRRMSAFVPKADK